MMGRTANIENSRPLFLSKKDEGGIPGFRSYFDVEIEHLIERQKRTNLFLNMYCSIAITFQSHKKICIITEKMTGAKNYIYEKEIV